MKKKFFGALVVFAITVGAMVNVNLNKVNTKVALSLANVEALAQGDGGANGEIGTTGTNWKDTTFTCTKTVGVDYGVVYTTTTTYTKVGCGYGSGWCLSPAGC